MTVRFERETHIDAPAELVFDLSLDIDAHRASMSASNERAIAGVTMGRIGLGETVTWRAKLPRGRLGPSGSGATWHRCSD